MATARTTTRKPPAKPFTGTEGVKFSKENQPAPERKKAGWEEVRKKKLLTQSVIQKMIGEDGEPNKTFGQYVTALIRIAKKGNPKAIETINRCLEDEVIKIANTDPDGNPVSPVTKVEIVRPTKTDAD